MMAEGDRAARLVDIIGRFDGLNVWVAGDIMLDEYVVGKVGRISPEAPVPVVHIRERIARLGGATNVARQIAVLGANVSLTGVIGRDEAGDTVLRVCRENSIDTRAVGRLDDGPTTHKIRVLGQRQQLLRLDWEERRPCPFDLAEELVGKLDSGEPPDVLILSDYAKGFLSKSTMAVLVDAARRHGAPVLVDPKRDDLGEYTGATIVKPNLRELEAATGLELSGAVDRVIVDAARQVLAGSDTGALVVTLGERGMLIVPRDGEHLAVKGHRRAVFDVTGAGDTAMAVLALGLGAGASLEDSTRLANLAAGIAVGEVGTAAVSRSDLLADLGDRSAGKVMNRRGLAAQVESWRLQGKRVVFTNGCFDLLHTGHLSLLREAAQLGDILVLAINSDASVRRLKGEHRPLVPQAERAALLAALDCVDAVTVFDEDTPLETLEMIRPDVLVKGQDYRIHEVVGRELVESNGGRVELVPLLPEKSTTALIERIRRAYDE
jgi:D-beta-D-heptose 7-phosphate kinase/D-beta-D-heptose 1-phosphate adenosyltransferase